MRDKLIAVVAWCFMLLFATILACGVYAQMKQVEAIEEMALVSDELENKLIEYMNGQIEYYEYNLNGLKEYDETRDYVYDYSEWLREEVGIE